MIEDYDAGMRQAGFEHVAIVDTGADLTSYALVEGQAGCCTPPPATDPKSSLAIVDPESDEAGGCCQTETLHSDLAKLFADYDVNAHAAAVRIFAVKPK